ncbi:MAG: hypothetical protein ACKVP5_07715 [Aestuariivirga sp.]
MTKLNWGKRFRVIGVPHFPAKPENPKVKKVESWRDREIREIRKSYRHWKNIPGKKAQTMAKRYLKRIKELGGNA